MPPRPRSSTALADSAVDYVDRLIGLWEQAQPSRPVFRAQEALLRLVRVGGHLRREMDELAAAEGLLAAQAQALVTLRLYDPRPVTPKEVSEATTLTSGAVTPLLDKLERKRLLVRRADPTDRRGTWLVLTERGRSAADRIITARIERNQQRLQALTPAERATLAELLRKLESPAGPAARA